MTAVWEWPQITYAVLAGLNLINALSNIGKPKGNYSLSETLVTWALTITLLYFGGFWVR